jgi:hypothetical protein
MEGVVALGKEKGNKQLKYLLIIILSGQLYTCGTY